MDHDPAHGATQRAWLREAGYVIAFRSAGWIECLIRLDNERWFGTGGDEAEAFANALHAALPSEAARRAFEIATRNIGAAKIADPAEPVPPPPAIEFAVDPVPNNDLVEGTATLPPTIGATDISENSILDRVEASAPSVAATPEAPVDSLATPAHVLPAAAEPVVLVPVPLPEIVERLSLAAAHAELDDLQKAIQENYEEASLLAPVRQRMLVTQWMARARAIEAAAAPDHSLAQRVYGIAQEIGKLSKVWWPGSVQVLAKANAPSSCRRDFNPDFDADLHTWRDVENAAAAEMERLEDEAQNQGLDDLGWVDAPALDPAPRDPVAILNEIRAALELRTSPRLLAPHEAIHTEHLKPALRPESANNQIKWAEIAAKVRWLRGCPPSVEIWGAAMGRLRWLAEHDDFVGDAIRAVLDPQFMPPGNWMKHLGVDKQERRRQRSAVVRRTPTAGATDAEIQQWMKDALEFGDDLPNERIAELLRDLTPQVLAIPESVFSERKHRRRIKNLQAQLRGEVPAATNAASLTASANEPEPALEVASAPTPSLEDKLVERLRPYTVGKRVLFVSNRLDRDRDAKLQDLLGFSSIDACLHEPARVDSKAQAIGRGSYDIVLAATGFIPHKVDGTLKGACRLVGIPYVRVNRGRSLQCLLHLARELGIADQFVA